MTRGYVRRLQPIYGNRDQPHSETDAESHIAAVQGEVTDAFARSMSEPSDAASDKPAEQAREPAVASLPGSGSSLVSSTITMSSLI
jgi:hypothetical protein